MGRELVTFEYFSSYFRTISLQSYKQNWLENSKIVSWCISQNFGLFHVEFKNLKLKFKAVYLEKVCINLYCRDPFIIFAGGMPRASYGDKHTVSVMQGSNNIHTVLDFTSKVVDFITISRADETDEPLGMWNTVWQSYCGIDNSNC